MPFVCCPTCSAYSPLHKGLRGSLIDRGRKENEACGAEAVGRCAYVLISLAGLRNLWAAKGLGRRWKSVLTLVWSVEQSSYVGRMVAHKDTYIELESSESSRERLICESDRGWDIDVGLGYQRKGVSEQ